MLKKNKKGAPTRPSKVKKMTKSHLSICIIFMIIGFSLLIFRFFPLNEKMNNAEDEKDRLHKLVTEVGVMGEVNKLLINDFLRQRAVELCFQELTNNYINKFNRKELEECIQLIMMADEKFRKRGIDAPLILAWLEKESDGNPEAVSYAGAKGLTQLMDFRARQIFAELGYSDHYRKIIFNPVINLMGGLHHLDGLIDYWENKGIKNQSLVLFYAIHSYKWGSRNTGELFNNEKRSFRPAIEYVNWILNRREYWVDRVENLIEISQNKKREYYLLPTGGFENGGK